MGCSTVNPHAMGITLNPFLAIEDAFAAVASFALLFNCAAGGQQPGPPATAPSTSQNLTGERTSEDGDWAAISVSDADWAYGVATGLISRASAEAAAVRECRKLTSGNPDSCVVVGMSSPPFTGVGWHCEKEDDASVGIITAAHFKGDEIGSHISEMRKEAARRGYHPNQCWPVVYVVGRDIYQRKNYDLDKTFPR